MNEKELWSRYTQDPSPQTGNDLICFYRPWLARQAHKYARKYHRILSYDEIFVELQLITSKKLHMFEPSRNIKFTTYLQRALPGGLQDYCRIIDPMSRTDRRKRPVKFHSFERKWQNGQDETDFRNHQSFSTLLTSEHEDCNPITNSTKEDLWREVRRALRCSPISWQVVNAMDRHGWSQPDASAALGVCESRISQIHKQAHNILKSSSRLKALFDKEKKPCSSASPDEPLEV